MAIDAPPHLEPPPEAPVPRNSGRGPIALIVVAAMVLAAIGIVAFMRGGDGGDAGRPETPTFNGTVIDPGRPRPQFTLTATDGRPYDFATETAGKLTFLFFGYTNCPDVCPISMNVLTRSLSELNRVGAKVVFVTTDPSRDTPERLEQWLAPLATDVVGLTGTVDELEAAQEAAGVTAAIAEAPDENGRYVVGHSSAMNVYTPDDLQHLRYAPNTTQAQWMDDIPRIAADPAWNAARGVAVTDAYAGPSSGGSQAIYLTVVNGSGVDDSLVGVSSSDSSGATLHLTEGTSMTDTDEIDVPAGQGVRMEPGGSHVMLSGLADEVTEGQTVTVTLTFRRAAPVTVTVPVVSFDSLAARIGG